MDITDADPLGDLSLSILRWPNRASVIGVSSFRGAVGLDIGGVFRRSRSGRGGVAVRPLLEEECLGGVAPLADRGGVVDARSRSIS